jgi:hypothetical protein
MCTAKESYSFAVSSKIDSAPGRLRREHAWRTELLKLLPRDLPTSAGTEMGSERRLLLAHISLLSRSIRSSTTCAHLEHTVSPDLWSTTMNSPGWSHGGEGGDDDCGFSDACAEGGGGRASEGAGYGRTHIGTGSSEGGYDVSAIGVVGVVGVGVGVFRVGDTAKARQILCDGPKCSPNVFGVDRTDDDILGAGEEYRCWQTLSSNDRPGEGGRTKANAETRALKSVCRLRDVDAEVWEVAGPSARHYARLERLVWRRFFSATLAEESTGDMRR